MFIINMMHIFFTFEETPMTGVEPTYEKTNPRWNRSHRHAAPARIKPGRRREVSLEHWAAAGGPDGRAGTKPCGGCSFPGLRRPTVRGGPGGLSATSGHNRFVSTTVLRARTSAVVSPPAFGSGNPLRISRRLPGATERPSLTSGWARPWWIPPRPPAASRARSVQCRVQGPQTRRACFP